MVKCPNGEERPNAPMVNGGRVTKPMVNGGRVTKPMVNGGRVTKPMVSRGHAGLGLQRPSPPTHTQK